MKKIMFSVLLVALMSLPTLAQDFTIRSLASPGITSVVSSKAHLKFSGSFEPSSSGDCTFPYPTQCRDLRVGILDNGLQLASLISVSTTEVRLITPNVSSNGEYTIIIQKQTSPGNWTTTHIKFQNCYRNFPLPFVQGAFPNNIYLGVVYGSESNCGATALQSIGTSNPRGYNGKATFLQVYYTGVHSDDWDDADWFIDSEVNPFIPYTKAFDGVYSEGVYILNLFNNTNQSDDPCFEPFWAPTTYAIRFTKNTENNGTFARVTFN